MIAGAVRFVSLVEAGACGNVDLATDDGLETLVAFLAFVYFA